MTGIFRGLVLSLAVACALLQAADAASCTDDLDCPLKQCCTGNSSRAGVCSPLFVNGKQACLSCKSYVGRQVECPKTARVCCADGVCRKSAVDCKCSSDADCPLQTCCTGTYLKPGYCSPKAFVKGKYVCQDCKSRSPYGDGLTSCPADASICCADGRCVRTAPECQCERSLDCPAGFCCSGNSNTPGRCTTQRIVNGKQACPDCQAFKADCPKEASVCCFNGACAKSPENCTCSSNYGCGMYTCCTGDSKTPGKCSKSAFVGGKQVCKDCRTWRKSGQKCPVGRSYCCSDGTCQASLAGCSCRSNSDCEGNACCTGTAAKPGTCSLSAYVNGVQKCSNCKNDALCPKNYACCADGTCQPKSRGCGCRSPKDCPAGTCCTGDRTAPGKCVAQAFVGGKQVCKGCGTFGGKSLSCGKGQKCCSKDKSCSATGVGCPCEYNDECAQGQCCTGGYSDIATTIVGVCSASVFVGGKQVCPGCSTLGDQKLACPPGASVCCKDGSCKASLAGCSCSSNNDCPTGACCTVQNSNVPGVCSPSIFDARGKQVCPSCRGDVKCPKNLPVCCPSGSCQTSASKCQCDVDIDCPDGTCCVGSSSAKKGTCTTQPFVNGTQVCRQCQNFFAGLKCPPKASVCCPDGSCKASLASCKCTSDLQCGLDKCCTSKGVCSTTVFSKGVQICPDCNIFNANYVECPAPTQCCDNGLCKAKC